MKTLVGDNAGYFPDMQSAKAYLDGSAGSNTSADYHSDRMRALRLLLDAAKTSPTERVIDFGCGNGLYFKEFFQPQSVKQIVGIDVSAPMIHLATENLRGFPFDGKTGDAGTLKAITGKFDLGLAIDVLGYLDEPELETFYREMSRLIRPGGHLIIMYGNELFDMFALNSGTADFYVKHFDIDVIDLLTEGRSDQYKPANRKNPLSFGADIAPYGFSEIKQSFSQWHRVPPAIGNRAPDLAAARMNMRDHSFDPNQLAPKDKWKAFFRSSIFASLSQRI